MSKATTVNPADKIQNSLLFRLKGFIKTKFFGSYDPLYEKYTHLNQLKYSLVNSPVSRQFITKNQTFSRKFCESLLKIYRYTKAFKEHVNWDPLFKEDQFPLFLVNYFSTQQQKDWFLFFSSREQIKRLIEEKGIQETTNYIQKTFSLYKNSFTFEQVYKINNILASAVELHTFIKFDFHQFFKVLLIDYSETTLRFKDIKNINVATLTEELNQFLNYTSVINKDSQYFQFFEIYSEYLDKKIISQNDFNLFLEEVNSFSKGQFLTNIVKICKQDSLLRPLKPLDSYNKPTVTNAIKALSEKTKNNHVEITTLLKEQGKNLLIEELFKKETVHKIIEHQKIMDKTISKQDHGKSFSSLLTVLSYFKRELFDSHIEKTFHNILQKAIFLIPSFQDDFIKTYKNYSKLLDYAEKTLSTFEEEQHFTTALIEKLEQASHKILFNFVQNSSELFDFFTRIHSAGIEEVSGNSRPTISMPFLENLLINIKVSNNFIHKLELYLKISINAVV